MLDEYKQLYTECANLIPNWQSLNKNELANLYLENENNEMASSYFSALICKFWNLIGHYYYKQGIKIATELDCYDWIIDGITEALKDRVWKNPDNQLYSDKKGPEKAIVVNIMSIRANFYQYTKYDKRKINYTSYSLDELEENCSDGYITQYEDKYDNLFDYIKQQVIESFSKKDYFIGFFLDALHNFNLFFKDIDRKDVIDIKKFNRYIESVDDNYLHYFSTSYEIEFEIVKNAFSYLKIMPAYRIHSNINRTINLLKNDEYLYSILGD